jgi:hypothetical protein
MRSEELVSLRGGYDIEGGPYYVSCKVQGNSCGGFWVGTCPNDMILWNCQRIWNCIDADSYVCV